MYCGMAGVDVAFFAEVAQGVHAFFDGAHAVQTPLGVDDGLGALAFGESFGGQTGEEIGGENLVSEEVFCGENYYAGGEAVAQSAEAGSVPAQNAWSTAQPYRAWVGMSLKMRLKCFGKFGESLWRRFAALQKRPER
jgi:hypothetical protein